VQEDQKPDLLITASGGMKEQTSYTAMGMRGFGGGMGSITPQQNVIGTLIVDLFDAKSQSLVWRGIAGRFAGQSKRGTFIPLLPIPHPLRLNGARLQQGDEGGRKSRCLS
jgi:Domain of unknown function (DUF4136)